MKTILVPVNFSEASLKAVAQAVQIAEKMHEVEILLLHGVTKTSTEVPEIEQQFKEISNQYMDSSVHFRTQVIAEFSPEKIAEVTEQNDEIGLVVMGTEGKNRAKGFWGDSNTAKVEELLTCPLMVVPKEAENRPLRKMVYALSFDKEDLDEIDRVLNFAQLFNAHLECIRMVDERDEKDRHLLEVLTEAYDLPKYQGKITFKSLSRKNSANALESYVFDNQIDMTVLLTRQRNFWEKNFGSSLTQKLTLHAKIPLLVLNKDELK